MRSLFQYTSSPPAPSGLLRFSTRDKTNSKSLKRFRYWRGASFNASAEPSATTARSARRATVRHTCASDAAREPAGKINSARRGKVALYFSSAASSSATASGLSSSKPGMLSSPPKLNNWCCTSTSSVRTSSGMASHSSTPMQELSSSTSPMACTRKLSLLTRVLSPRPVVPLSPVRVAICVSRLDMLLLSGKVERGERSVSESAKDARQAARLLAARKCVSEPHHVAGETHCKMTGLKAGFTLQ